LHMADNKIIDKLFSIGAHYGLSASRRHPSVSSFIFGQKGGVELFDLEQTAALLDEALKAMKSLAAERKVVLFVGGKAEAREALARVAEGLAMPYVAGRWIGGTLTNWGEIKKRLGRLADLSSMREKGELAKFTKRERLLIDRDITDLEAMFGGLRGMQKLPDAMVVVDPRAEEGSLKEAKQLGLPVIALMNSDCNREGITYPIPANDASRETVNYILGELAKAYSESVPAEVKPQ